MKIKKLLYITTLLVLLVLTTHAQNRENKQMIQFSSQSEKLKDATGWEQNKETGKWIENNNVIDDRACPSYWVSHVAQNFKWIQFATISNNGQKYFVLLYEQISGEYKYPNIEEDWEANIRTCYLIFTQTQYNELKNQINLKSSKNIKIVSKMSGYLSDRYKILGGEYLYNEENLLAKITNSIEKPRYSETCFVFNSQILDGQEIVRFRLPESCDNAEDYIKTKYFEIKATNFKAILTE